MSIEELLAQVGTEHRLLRARYDEALLEIEFLRTELAKKHAADHNLTMLSMSQAKNPRGNLQEDIEAAAFQHTVVCEQLHSTQDSTGLEAETDDEVPSERKNEVFLKFESRTTVMTQSMLQSGNPWQDKARRFLLNPVVEGCLILVLMSNCVIMWIETDKRASSLKATPWIEAVDMGFLALYVAEFAVRAFAFRTHVLQDNWTRLDLFVIAMDTLTILGKQIWGSNFFGGLSLSLFRLFRIFRVTRVFKILRYVSELQLLIHGFYGAMKAVFFVVIMLEIVILLWCFVLVETIHPLAAELQCEHCPTAYSSMWQSHLTIVQQIIAGDSWGSVNLIIIEAHPPTALLFFACLITIQFGMLNLIFTVIVDAAHRARDEDEQHKLDEKNHHFKKLKERLIEMCNSLDADGDGELCLQELIDGFETNPAFADTMASLDVTAEDMGLLFTILDEDRSGAVSSIEFVNNIYKLKEQDIHTTLMFIKGYLVDLRIKVGEDISDMLSKNVDIVTNTQQDLKGLIHDFENRVLSSDARSSKEKAGKTTLVRPLEEKLLVKPQHKLAKISEVNDLQDAACFFVSEDVLTLPTVPVPTPSRAVGA